MSTSLKSPAPATGSAAPREANTGDTTVSARPLTIVLAGNPNAGKTSLFNALTGLRQKVANYPGVTVERKEGHWQLAPELPPALLIDLPGLYSLDANSIDEQIARDVITGRLASVPRPDCIIAVVDATNLERNLYLATQLLETGRPLVVALTMIDLAERHKLEIDAARLSIEFGVAVVPVVAKQRQGLDALAEAVLDAAHSVAPHATTWRLSADAERELRALAAQNLKTGGNGNNHGDAANIAAEAETDANVRRYDALVELYAEELPEAAERQAAVAAARARLAEKNPRWWQEPLLARYNWIEGVARRTVRDHKPGRTRRTDRIDRFVTHKFFGPLILVVVMLVILQTIFSWAQLPMDLIDGGFGRLGELVRNTIPPGLLTDLLVDGVIAGVGGVLVFLPQILLLFFFISLLEDSGYMARAAFLMDRLMRGVGLHGKAFMPLLSSFACAIPGIMATRTIENPKDRLATILIAPFMSCSARLPVYTLMIAAFFSRGEKVFGVLSVGVLIIMAMYLLGVAVAVAVAWILKHTILKSPPPPLVLELPPYRMPNPVNVLQTIRTRAWMFVRRAGTVILAISILLWALVTFPRMNAVAGDARSDDAAATATTTSGSTTTTADTDATTKTGRPATTGGATTSAPDERTTTAEREESVQPAAGASNVAEAVDGDAGEQIRQSYAGRLGRLIEPAIAPLGFDWKMGIGLIASFAARETLVSTLSIVYNVGEEATEESSSLIEAVRGARRPDGAPAWTPLVAVSMMVFFVLACQCMSTIAIVRRETNSWRWPLFMVAYMLVLAYVASFITYQGGRLLGFS
ncbi:MAG TPA: ferrous iron transport protein B [Pyrinomonadaceae bacterium]|nr:ferrous iron transport protein B [Pyrinomonadaceae bacterium]